jgi:hypothetical protein
MSLIDEILNDAMRRGDFDNLPGAGKPLRFEDESHVPHELRMAHRLLKENDLTPDWIAEAKALAAARAQVLSALERAGRRARDTAAGDRAWMAALADFRVEAARLNKRILSLNLKLPPGVDHWPLIDIDREIGQAG